MKDTNPPAVTMRVRVGDSEIEVTGPANYVEKKIAEFTQAPTESSRGRSKRATSGISQDSGEGSVPGSVLQIVQSED